MAEAPKSRRSYLADPSHNVIAVKAYRSVGDTLRL